MSILTSLLTGALARGPYRDLEAFRAHLTTCPFTTTVEHALWAGLQADRLGYAFAGGYAAALARLLDHAGLAEARPFPARLSLCATEAGGAHPRQIATRLEARGKAFVLDGEKTFATLASAAEELLVVASRGPDAQGRNRLQLVRVRPDARGVHIEAREALPFAPEIPHAVVRFVDVIVESEDVIAGDGYERYLKPFRTIEDTHVLAATVGYLLGAARASGFDRGVTSELVSLAAALVDLARRDPAAPLTHIVLAGLFGSARRLLAALGPEWEKASEDERLRFQRDQALLLIADRARAMRMETAWKSLLAT